MLEFLQKVYLIVLTIDRNIVYTIYANDKCLNVKTYLVICLVYRDAFSIIIIDVAILLTLDLKINLVGNLLLIIWYIFKKLDDMKSWKTILSQIPFFVLLDKFCAISFINSKISSKYKNKSEWLEGIFY